MNKSLNIDISAYEGISEIKKNYSFKSFSDCISSMTYFFKNNNISPRENIAHSYSDSLFLLRKELLTKLDEIETKGNVNTERVIKIQRRIEEDILKPVNKKINGIHTSVIKEYNEDHNLKQIELNTTKNEDSLQAQKIIAAQDKSLEEYKKLLFEQENLVKEYNRCMRKLNENMKVETTHSGKKIFINLPVEQAEELFHLIP